MKKIFFVLTALFITAGYLAAGGKAASGSSKVTWWLTLNANVSANYANLGETPFGKALVEKTGVNIEFQHPPASGATEAFNLLMAGGELPDIMEWNWKDYPGGPEKAMADGVIIPLNDLIAKYAPNLTKFLKENPEYDKMIRTDSGKYYNFPMIRGDPMLLNSTGAFIRKDWLDELGLAVPTTIDEWHSVLSTIKQKKGVTPLAFEASFLFSTEDCFSYAYNTRAELYIGTDGKTHYGQVENGFRDYVTMMSQWYKEGLLDTDIATLSFNQVSAKMTGGQAAASMGYLGSRMGSWLTSGRKTNPAYTLVATPYPVLKKGDTVNFSPISIPYNYAGGCAAITASCKNVEAAVKLLDWGYSDEGKLFYNFGIEGVSYTMVNGNPVYTNLIMKNPQGLPITQAMAAYCRANYNGPFVQDGRYITQYQATPEQAAALKLLALPNTLARVPPALTPTPEESREYAAIMQEIKTYANEMLTKFVLGTEPLSKWSNYVDTINKMGLPKALALRDAALARYNKR